MFAIIGSLREQLIIKLIARKYSQVLVHTQSNLTTRNKAKQSSCSFLLILSDSKALKFTLLYGQNGQPREPY